MNPGFPSRFLRTPELEDRADEILIGLVVAYFVGQGDPLYRIQIEGDQQKLRFRTQDDSVLHAVEINLRRINRGAEGSLTITAEIKNFLANPRDLLKLHEQMPAQLPQPSGVKLFRQLNSVFASLQVEHVLGNLSEPESRLRLTELLGSKVGHLRDVLRAYRLENPSN